MDPAHCLAPGRADHRRTRKTRKFFVFLREHRHAWLAADCQQTLAPSESPELGSPAPVAAGLVALATLVQA